MADERGDAGRGAGEADVAFQRMWAFQRESAAKTKAVNAAYDVDFADPRNPRGPDGVNGLCGAAWGAWKCRLALGHNGTHADESLKAGIYPRWGGSPPDIGADVPGGGAV